MENELSEREAEVLRLASEGHIDDSIAARLGISVSTVRGYWLRIRSKLGAGSRSELVAKYVKEQSDIRHQADSLAEEVRRDAAQHRTDEKLAIERALVDELMRHSSEEDRKRLQDHRTASDAASDHHRESDLAERHRRQGA